MSCKQARRTLLARRRSLLSAGAGLMVGVVFSAAGRACTIHVRGDHADERFIIMVGFSPIAVIGGLLVVRLLAAGILCAARPVSAAHEVASAAARQPPVTRVSRTVSYQAVLLALLFGLLMFVITGVIAAIYNTVSMALR